MKLRHLEKSCVRPDDKDAADGDTHSASSCDTHAVSSSANLPITMIPSSGTMIGVVWKFSATVFPVPTPHFRRLASWAGGCGRNALRNEVVSKRQKGWGDWPG